jgi:hypothetical protein
MIRRSPIKNAQSAPSKSKGKNTLLVTTFEQTKRDIDELAEEEGVTVRTLMHEAIALLFRQRGQPLPDTLAEYLRAHGRPIPPPKRAKFRNDLN